MKKKGPPLFKKRGWGVKKSLPEDRKNPEGVLRNIVDDILRFYVDYGDLRFGGSKFCGYNWKDGTNRRTSGYVQSINCRSLVSKGS
jgi:hypothetical protein